MVTAGHPFSNKRDMNSPHQVKVAIDTKGRAMDFSRKPPPLREELARFNRTSSRAGTAPKLDRLNRSSSEGRVSKVLRHQGIYAFRRPALLRFVKWKQTRREKREKLEQLRALENGVTVHVLVTKHGSPGVDTPQDVKTGARALQSGARRRFPSPQSSPRGRGGRSIAALLKLKT